MSLDVRSVISRGITRSPLARARQGWIGDAIPDLTFPGFVEGGMLLKVLEGGGELLAEDAGNLLLMLQTNNELEAVEGGNELIAGDPGNQLEVEEGGNLLTAEDDDGRSC